MGQESIENSDFNQCKLSKIEIDNDDLIRISHIINRHIDNQPKKYFGSMLPFNYSDELNKNQKNLTFRNLAASLYRFRRNREQIFGGDLFADPAWDILLDLYVNDGFGLPVTVSDACIGSAVPSTTAMRYIMEMENRGLITREKNKKDKRVVYIRLTAIAISLLEETFHQYLQGSEIG